MGKKMKNKKRGKISSGVTLDLDRLAGVDMLPKFFPENQC